MKKIILLIMFAFTAIMITQATYANVQSRDTVFLETKIISNNIVYGINNRTLVQIIQDMYVSDETKTYVSLIPNETTTTILYQDYYYNVKTIIITYEGPYAVVTLLGVSLNFIDELYLYMPNINTYVITLIPNESTYDQGYQEGIRVGKNDGIQQGYNNARSIFGIEVNGQWLTSVEYASRQVTNAIEQTILEWGINVNGILYKASEYGDMRYQQGLDANANTTVLGTILGGVATIFGTGLAFILQLGSIELMGISLNMILGIGLLLVGLLAILGLIFGGK